MKPLKGIRIIDFTTLLPGPLATLMLSDAGAEVIKVEKEGGEDLRKESILFAMLNRGKKSIVVNLKKEESRKKILELIKKCDVLIEQFRPGVMKKFGLDWNNIKKINKKIIYCSITGYGQSGIKKNKAGHDINYLAESGLLSLSTFANGKPSIPFTQVADIAGGSYPAFMNILLALFKTNKTGLGCFLDVSMYENLIPLAWLGLTKSLIEKKNVKSNSLHLNGGIARYNIYETKDNKFLALGALEDKFWKKFCKIINAPYKVLNEELTPKKLINTINKIIKLKTEKFWKNKFDKEENVCCTSINSLSQFLNDPHILNKKIFSNKVMTSNNKFNLIPTSLDRSLVKLRKTNHSPKLGQHNNLFKKI